MLSFRPLHISPSQVSTAAVKQDKHHSTPATINAIILMCIWRANLATATAKLV